MEFELKHNDSRLSREKILTDYHFPDPTSVKIKTPIITDKSLLTSVSDQFPDEMPDPEITCAYFPDRINYVSFYGMEEGGELPDDLTPTEILLTKLLWGEADRFMTILLVSAIEDMSIEDATKSLAKMKLF